MSSNASTLAGPAASVLSQSNTLSPLVHHALTDPVLRDTFNVGGIKTNVYSLSALNILSKPCPEEPIAVLFLLHGRQGSSDMEIIDKTAREAVLWAEERKDAVKAQGGKQRDFVVVTFDQRNHGCRMVDSLANNGWNPDASVHNERHAIDMYAIFNGTARDVSFLIDFLPAYLFPNGERMVAEWAVAGISLGGHATWYLLANEPRVRIGIPIIGCPAYLTMLAPRALKASVPLAPPYIPTTLLSRIQSDFPSYYQSHDSTLNPFIGKRVLVLSGEKDRLVPWDASSAFVEGLEVGKTGRRKVRLQEGVGHEYTKEMKGALIEFFWEEALVTGLSHVALDAASSIVVTGVAGTSATL